MLCATGGGKWKDVLLRRLPPWRAKFPFQRNECDQQKKHLADPTRPPFSKPSAGNSGGRSTGCGHGISGLRTVEYSLCFFLLLSFLLLSLRSAQLFFVSLGVDGRLDPAPHGMGIGLR